MHLLLPLQSTAVARAGSATVRQRSWLVAVSCQGSPNDGADELQQLKAALLRSERGRQEAEQRAADEARGREVAEQLMADRESRFGAECDSPSQMSGMPPDTLFMVPEPSDGDDTAEAVSVDHLVGSGGFCDVFSATWRGASCALKLPRSASDEPTLAALRCEASALRKLARAASPHVPRLLSASTTAGGGAALLLHPLGTVAALAPGAAAAAGSPERVRLAEACARGVLTALRAARKERIVHRDVRPSNVLWHEAGGCAQLIDWGISRTYAADMRALQPAALGWPDTAPDAALSASARTGLPWLPSPATDVASALYTLAAIAFGEPCGTPPWAAAADASAVAAALAAAEAASTRGPAAQDAAMSSAVVRVRLERRDAWFAALPRSHTLVKARDAAHRAQDVAVGRPTRLPCALRPGWADLRQTDDG